MASTDIIEALQSAGIAVEDGGEFRLSEDFGDRLDSTAEAVSEATDEELRSRLREPAPDRGTRERLLGLPADGLAEYLAVAESTDAFGHEERLRVLTVLDQLRRGTPRADGCPENFLPVHGDRLALLFGIYPRLVVYIWREECPPCDTVRSDLEALSLPEDVMCVSVYGPEWSRTLQENYGIASGPVLVFVRDGEIETRLYGARDPETVETELGKVSSLE